MRLFVFILHKKYAHCHTYLYSPWWDHISKKVIISPITIIFTIKM